jgi:hypothetical protein
MRAMTMSRSVAAVAMLALAAACANDPTGISDPNTSTNAGAMSLAPATSTLQPGQSLALRVSQVDAFGRIDRTPVIKWMSSNPAVATVSGAGLVRAIKEGDVKITAEGAGQSRSSTSQVLRPTPIQEVRTLRPNMEPWDLKR